jgi:pyridoxamine 5'-phosphate oxidase
MAVFRRHLARAGRGQPEQVSHAMTLATNGPRGQPRSRVMLLRGLDGRGFVFFTNLRSAKGQDLARSPKVALCFHWPHIGVQVRVLGEAHRVADAEADAYFATRPRDSQVGAWASDQSRPLANRAALMRRFAKAQKRFAGAPVPRPSHWSGFRVRPDLIEFWHGRENRLHDREIWTRRGRTWRKGRLFP